MSAAAYALDTNICIYLLKATFPALVARLRAMAPGAIKIPSMVEAELRLGAEKSVQRVRVHAALDVFLAPFEVLPFDHDAAQVYAVIRGALERKGTPIGPSDLVIAATTMAHGHVLVTHNTAEFRRVAGLNIEDWTVA